MTPPPIDDIRELAEAYVAGTLSPEQLQALEAQLRGGEAARLCFLSLIGSMAQKSFQCAPRYWMQNVWSR